MTASPKPASDMSSSPVSPVPREGPVGPNPVPGDDLEHSARRGAVFIPMAKLWFMLSAFLLQVALPRVLASPALYGLFVLVSSWFSTLNNVLVTGTIQTVAYFAARGPLAVEEAKRTALKMNLWLGGGATILFCVLAPAIAHFEHDTELIEPLRAGSLIVLLYSFYSVFVGAANGARQFHKQAGLDIVFATLRVGFLLAFAYVTHSVLWAVLGWAVAAVVILFVAAAVVGMPKRTPGKGAPIAVRTMLAFGAGLSLYLLSQNALLFLDGWWLKRLYSEALSHLSVVEQKRIVDGMVGVYGAAQTVARLPYQLVLAVTFVVFPLLSAPALKEDPERAQRYVRATLRYSLIGAVGMCLALSARPHATLSLLFPPEYAVGSRALHMLLWAYVCLSLFSIVGTIANSLGRVRDTVILGFVALVLTSVSVYFSIRSALLVGAQPLRATAFGMLLGLGASVVLGLMYLWNTLRVTIPAKSVLRVALCGGAVLWVAPHFPLAGKVGALAGSVVFFVAYFALLFASRELSISELLASRNPGQKTNSTRS